MTQPAKTTKAPAQDMTSPGEDKTDDALPCGHSAPVDEKERAIVRAARQTFLYKGFDAASMDAIAATANVSKRTVYNRFRSKEELFAAAILETCQRVLPVNLEEIEHSLPIGQLLRALSRQFMKTSLEPESLALRRIAAFEASRTPSLGLAFLENGPNRVVKTMAPIMRRIIQRDNLKIDDPERAIWQLGALITEPLDTYILMGAVPEDLDSAIDDQIETGLAAFAKIYDLNIND